jgi:hypothetical protein
MAKPEPPPSPVKPAEDVVVGAEVVAAPAKMVASLPDEPIDEPPPVTVPPNVGRFIRPRACKPELPKEGRFGGSCSCLVDPFKCVVCVPAATAD